MFVWTKKDVTRPVSAKGLRAVVRVGKPRRWDGPLRSSAWCKSSADAEVQLQRVWRTDGEVVMVVLVVRQRGCEEKGKERRNWRLERCAELVWGGMGEGGKVSTQCCFNTECHVGCRSGGAASLRHGAREQYSRDARATSIACCGARGLPKGRSSRDWPALAFTGCAMPT